MDFGILNNLGKTVVGKFLLRMGVISSYCAIAFLTLGIKRVNAAPELKGEELYQLCSSFPLNSRCEGYEVPIALEKRTGKEGVCIFREKEQEVKAACKVNISDTGILIYQEIGEELKLLDDNKSTSQVNIPSASLRSFYYEALEKNNVQGQVLNTLLFGLAGLALTPKKKLAEIEINYTLADGTDSTLVVVVGRDDGKKMRSQLEALVKDSSQ